MKSLFLSFLLACSPTYHVVQRVRHVPRPQTCPTLSMLLGDFTLTSVALGLAVLRYSSNDYGKALTFSGIGMGIGLGANLAETGCRS